MGGPNMGPRASPQDRQYMHRQGIACVRVGAFGFVWLLNSGTRVSVVNSAGQERQKKGEEQDVRESTGSPPPGAKRGLDAGEGISIYIFLS